MRSSLCKATEDIVKMGDEIWVKCLGVDEKGRVKLSRKAAMAERDQEQGGKEAEAGGEARGDDGRDDQDQDRRGGRRQDGDQPRARERQSEPRN